MFASDVFEQCLPPGDERVTRGSGVVGVKDKERYLSPEDTAITAYKSSRGPIHLVLSMGA